MTSEGVTREAVLAALRAHGVTVSQGGEYYYLSRLGGRREAQCLPPFVPRRMVLYLARVFEIDPHYFWH